MRTPVSMLCCPAFRQFRLLLLLRLLPAPPPEPRLRLRSLWPGLPLGLLLALGGLLAATPPVAAADLATAQRAEESGQLPQALSLYRELSADPSTEEAATALLRIIELSPDAGEVAASAAAFLDHHRNRQGAVRAAEVLGHYRAARGEYRSAARYFAQAAVRASGDARLRLLILEGRALLGAGEVAKARERFQTVGDAQASGPLAASALLGAGDAFADEGDAARAEAAYRRYLERFPGADGTPIALGQLARVLDAEQQPEAAVELLRALVERYPDSFEAAAARDRLRREARQRAASEPVGPAPETSARGQYALQVGAFGDEENAQQLARQLRDLELPEVRIEREEREGKVFYRVRLGAYRDPEAAEAAGQRLRAEHGLAAQVVLR